MAVQAQYPSNVLLLNRKGQERKNVFGGAADYSLQLQADEVLLQSQIVYSNGEEVNPRKRTMETIGPVSEAPVDLFHHQSSNLFDPSRQHNQPASMASASLRVSFGDQKQQQMGPSSSPVSSFPSEDLSAQMKQQHDDIDQILQSQANQLRQALADQWQRHRRVLLAAARESSARALRDKVVEAEKASRRRAELEEEMARLAAEAKAWQAWARAQEAAAAVLQKQLQQAMAEVARFGVPPHGEADEQGCTGGAEDAESAHVDPYRSASGAPLCRACQHRIVSVLWLPCRHVCLCTGCESAVSACPVCGSHRSATIEVSLC